MSSSKENFVDKVGWLIWGAYNIIKVAYSEMGVKSRLFVLSLVGLFLFYLTSVHYTSKHEVGIIINKINNEISTDVPGLHITPPWYLVAKIDTRPHRVCVNSVSKTAACKLARFIPEKYEEFVKREGFRYYALDNFISYNSGYNQEYRGTTDILRGYAFSDTKVSFVEVKEEFHSEK